MLLKYKAYFFQTDILKAVYFRFSGHGMSTIFRVRSQSITCFEYNHKYAVPQLSAFDVTME